LGLIPHESKNILDRLNKNLIAIYNKNPNAFSFIYDAFTRHDKIFNFVVNKKLRQSILDVMPSNARNLNELAINNIQVYLQRPGDDINITGAHQDSGYYSEYGSSNSSLVCWIPLVKTKKGAGALEVIGGSHMLGPLKHEENSPEMRKRVDRNKKGFIYLAQDQYDENHFEALECDPGDILLMNYDTIHRSGLNNSDNIRITVIFRVSNIYGDSYLKKYGIW
jgi:ectoine hydroxylase-related dioxygenase (phytanoyl-CoA dioxygenase family)